MRNILADKNSSTGGIKDKSKETKGQIFRVFPMILVMIAIFFFSTMEGEESSETSGIFLRAIQKFAEEVSHRGLSPAALDSLHLIIRKCAHFTEYAVLGASIMYGFWRKFRYMRLPFLWPEMIAALYATTDEIHQYFVPGRYGTWTDVLIDSCGAITGIMIYFFFCRKKAA